MGYTANQYELMKLEKLTPENFIEFCDKNFYNLEKFNITLKEAINQARLYESIDRLNNEISELQGKINDIYDKNEEDIQTEYVKFLEKEVEMDAKVSKDIAKEMDRYREIMHFARLFDDSSLKHVWDYFKQPYYTNLELMTYEEYCRVYNNVDFIKGRIHDKSVEINDIKQKINKNQIEIDRYEKAKADFLAKFK